MEILHIFQRSVDILKDAFSREMFQRNLKVDISSGNHSDMTGEGQCLSKVRPGAASPRSVRIIWTS